MLPSQLLRCRPASSWSANMLLAIVLMLASIVAVVLMFSLSGVSARAVCQRLRLANCYNPLPVVSRMAAFEPMYFVFACLVPPGAFLLRNSVAAYIDAHEPILDAFPPEARQDVWCGCALWTLSGAALLWWPVPCKAPARARAHPRRLMFWVRVCVDLPQSQRAVGVRAGDVVQRQPLRRRALAARQAHADHELVGRFELLAAALLAQIPVVLLVAAVELQYRVVVRRDGAGQRIDQTLGDAAAQQPAAGLDLLDVIEGFRIGCVHGQSQ